MSQIRGVSTDLKSQKVELNLAADMKELARIANSESDQATELIIEIKMAIDDLDEAKEDVVRLQSSAKETIDRINANKFNELLDKADRMAKELGINSNDIDGYKQLAEAIGNAQSEADTLEEYTTGETY